MDELKIAGKSYRFTNLAEAEKKGMPVTELPFSIRILLENILRNHDGRFFTDRHIKVAADWQRQQGQVDVPFLPARVLMQDFTGVPAVVDIASLRSEMERRGLDAEKIQPLLPVDVVIDHSVQVDYYGTTRALRANVRREYQRNSERYRLLKWAQSAFSDFSVLPPGMGICHQVNLEYLAGVVSERGGTLLPDTLVGTDSHTPMVNGAGVLGWGVGGIEAEAAMLGQPIYFTLPEVIGVHLEGALRPGTTTTDLVLYITETLRKEGVVGKFVEFSGEAVSKLGVPDRATLSNMSPEFGCTVTYFPIDQRSIEYLELTGRSAEQIEIVEKYAKANLLWRSGSERIQFSKLIKIDLNEVQPAVAGPKRPQDRIVLPQLKQRVAELLAGDTDESDESDGSAEAAAAKSVSVAESAASRRPEDEGWQIPPGDKKVNIHTTESDLERIKDGSVVIAAITSCTNTSNPEVMVAAGLLARRAVEYGLRVPDWVKTSLAPGSRVVSDYLRLTALLPYLEALGFHVVGYGCTTCIGNSGDLPPRIDAEVKRRDLQVASVLSGNRNFEARIHPDVKMNFLASPPLVVAYALAGRVDIDITREPVGYDPNGEPVYLHELWPAPDEIRKLVQTVVVPKLFNQSYAGLYAGDELWQRLDSPEGSAYAWDPDSNYIREAPFFEDLPIEPAAPAPIKAARALLLLGDSVTTDHISPAGKFSVDSPAGRFLSERGVDEAQFNTYGSRRGNHEVMIRGTFANVRLKNYMVEQAGGFTLLLPGEEEVTVYEAAQEYQRRGVPLVVLAGKEYGCGSSRDWAAKGAALLGVRAVVAESFERIHRSNLIGMGVLPLQFAKGVSWRTLGLDGREEYTIEGVEEGLSPGQRLQVKAAHTRPGGEDDSINFELQCRLDSQVEVEYWRHGGVLNYVLRRYASKD
ncbi:MAG: aconitate hydratase AcnA [Spirochaetota bacterium]